MTNFTRDLLIGWSLLPFLTPARTRLLMDAVVPLERICESPVATLKAILNIDEGEAVQVKNPLQDVRIQTLRESVITIADREYPSLLREIHDPPLVLHVRGRLELLAGPALAVVGSRRASAYALNAARRLVGTLAGGAHLTIVSGLARGVDAAAHTSALESHGSTIAVLGTGIDVVYPASNRSLFERIAREGLLVSEFPPGTPPLAANFPMRNRVISGLALGTLVIEATARSGSLITARMAAEQGREVFAVPGSIFSSGSEGTHRLIQNGVKLVHDANDVLEELPGFARLEARRCESQSSQPDQELREVFDALSLEEERHIESLVTTLQRPLSIIAEKLLRLELGGWIRATPGARYVRNR